MDVVGGTREERVRKRYAAMDNVSYYDRVPHKRAMELMDQADLVSMLYDPALKVILISSANKMFESMMLGKPYICTPGSFPAQVAARFDLGWAVPYGDAGALGSLIDELRADPSLLIETGRRGRRAYEQNFTWPKQRENLEKLYHHVLQDGTPVAQRRNAGWSRFIGTHAVLSAASSDATPGMPQETDAGSS